MRFPSRLKLTIGQINGLRSFIEKTNDKSEYRRAVAVFQKADGKTYLLVHVLLVHVLLTEQQDFSHRLLEHSFNVHKVTNLSAVLYI